MNSGLQIIQKSSSDFMQPIHHFTPGGWYFVTTTTKNRTRIFLEDGAAKTCLIELQKALIQTDSRLFCYCLMPDHFHGIFRTDDLPRLMKLFKARSARKISAGRGSIWQRGYWEKGIRDARALTETINYIHMNPVNEGLVNAQEEYPYSSARQFMEKYGSGVFAS